MSSDTAVTTKTLLRATFINVRRTGGEFVLALLALIASNLWAEVARPGVIAGSVDLIAVTLIGYLYLRCLAQRSGTKIEADVEIFFTVLIVGLVSTLAIALGFVLLIVPGIYLMIKWTPAYAVVFLEDRGVTDALSLSWDMTDRSEIPMALASLIITLVMLSPIFFSGPLEVFGDLTSSKALLFISLAIDSAAGNGLLLVGYAYGFASYSLLTASTDSENNHA